MASAETRLRQHVARLARAEGWYVQTNHGSVYSGSGRSDLTICARGVFVAVEQKTAVGTPTPIQAQHIRAVRAAGGHAFIGRDPQRTIRAIQIITCGGCPYMSGDIELSDDFFSRLIDSVSSPPEGLLESDEEPDAEPDDSYTTPLDTPALLEAIFQQNRQIIALLEGISESWRSALEAESAPAPKRQPTKPRASRAAGRDATTPIE